MRKRLFFQEPFCQFIKRPLLFKKDLFRYFISIIDKISRLEEELLNKNYGDIAVTVLSEYTQVGEYINKLEKPNFDITLLDKDCKAGGSFHVLNLDKFDKNKVISISSVPEYNEEVEKRGISRVVFKDYQNLDDFSLSLMEITKKML